MWTDLIAMTGIVFLVPLFFFGLAWLMNRQRRVFRNYQDQWVTRFRKGFPRFGGTGNVVKDTQNIRVERYYFTGATTLIAGQPLVLQTNPATSFASTKGFPFDVQCPDANTVGGFVGIVHPESVGFVGPGYISVIVPKKGDILQVLCASTAVDQSIDNVLQLDNAIPTASSTNTTGGSGNGAFRQADIFSQSFASNTTVTLLGAANAIFKVKCRLLESFASVANSQSGVRALKWVQFT
jgi:hypothetical protein